MEESLTGKILIADPFLQDPHFRRSVIFLCDHKPEGSFGLVLNKKYDHPLGELLPELNTDFPVYFGGPVQPDTLHYLHQCPEVIPGSIEVTDGVFWGGDFEIITHLIQSNELSPAHIRFFVGYSGWGEGQLQNELEEKSWIIGNGSPKIIFSPNVEDTWKRALQHLGGEYSQMIHYPLDPQLN